MPNNSSRITSWSELISSGLVNHPIAVMALYFFTNAVIRAVLGAPPELDEAEQFAISTSYSFGYGPHPPLYQWLQVSAFNLFGVNYTAIAVVKNLILFGTYTGLYYLGILLTRDRLIAAIGSFGLLLSANFAWESQHDQSHTVSNTFLTVAVVLFTLSALEKSKIWHYAILGILIGLWSMAKYNFVFPLAGLVIALTLSKKGRSFLGTPALALTLILAVAIPWFHYSYILNNFAEATVKVAKLGIEQQGFLQTRVDGLIAFAVAFAGVHVVWLIFIGLGWLNLNQNTKKFNLNHSGEKRRQHSDCIEFSQNQKIFLRLCVTSYLLLIGFVLVVGTTRYRDHWLQPAAVFAPLAIAIIYRRFTTWKMVRPILLTAAIIMPVIISAYILNNLGIGTEQRDANLPSPVSVRAALADSTDTPLLLFAAPKHRYRWLNAGHLRSHIPHLQVVFEPRLLPPIPNQFWMVWREDVSENQVPESDLQAALEQYPMLSAINRSRFGTPIQLEPYRPDRPESQGAPRWWMAKYSSGPAKTETQSE